MFQPGMLDDHDNFVFFRTLFRNRLRVSEESEFTNLLFAAFTGDLELTNSLLQNGADVNARNSIQLTPLHVAVRFNHKKIVRALISKEADIDAEVDVGVTPLRLAVEGGYLPIVKMLVRNGANVHIRDDQDFTLLHIAASHGFLDMVTFFTDERIDVNVTSSAPDSFGVSPLHLAAMDGHSEVVNFLIKKHANINSGGTILTELSDGTKRFHKNIAPLCLAMQNDFTVIAKALLESGADINVIGTHRRSPLHLTCENGNFDLVKILLSRKSDVNCKDEKHLTPLHVASRNGHIEVVKALLKVKSIDVNSMSLNLGTPLHLAVAHGHFKIVKLLIVEGANINSKSLGGGSTPLLLALGCGHLPIVDFLIRNGSNIHDCDDDKVTPLHEACGRTKLRKTLREYSTKSEPLFDFESLVRGDALQGSFNNHNNTIIECLVKNGANVNVVDKDGWSPLFAAAGNGNVEIVKFLVSRDANVNIQAESSWTALHFAVMFNFVDVAKVLLQSGADVDIQASPEKLTPILLSAKFGHEGLVKLLLSYNADVNLSESGGKTPLHYFALSFSQDVVRLVLLEGADINSRGKFDATPLHVAVMGRNIDVVKLLLENGAFYDARVEMSEKESESILPLDFAKVNNDAKAIKLFELIEKLFSAVTKKDQRLLKYCIEEGAIVNVKNVSGRTPLLYAVSNGNVNAIKLLLSNGASIYQVSNKGNTPLHIAAFQNNFTIVKVLLQHAEEYANAVNRKNFVNAKTNEKCMTALHVASMKNNLPIVKLLLEHGAIYNPKNSSTFTPSQLSSDDEIKTFFDRVDKLFGVMKKEGDEKAFEFSPRDTVFINARDDDEGKTLLLWSVLKGHLDNALFLIENGADYTLVAEKGISPLYLASSKGNNVIVKAILTQVKRDKPASLSDIVNSSSVPDGSGPLHAASSAKVARTLLQFGASYNKRNISGSTPLDFTESASVRGLLLLTNELFEDAKEWNFEILKKVYNLEAEEILAVTNARGDDDLTLVQVLRSNGAMQMANQLSEVIKYRTHDFHCV